MITPCLDLTRYAWRQRHGDLVCYGTWRFDDDDKQWVPCLAIYPAFRHATPCVVTLDLAWIWSEEEGSPQYAAETTASFCESLGLAPHLQNCIRIASIIRDHLEDLIKRIPPKPPEKKVVADAILTQGNGKQAHAEITEHV